MKHAVEDLADAVNKLGWIALDLANFAALPTVLREDIATQVVEVQRLAHNATHRLWTLDE